MTAVLVTGGSGFLGRRVVSTLRDLGHHVVAPTSVEADVRDAEALDRAIDHALARSASPTSTAGADTLAVVHLAYRVDERDVIVEGSRAVADLAERRGARLVHLSTDVVFGGREAPYAVHDAPSPVNDYGRWKAEAEAVVLRSAPGATCVRTSLLLDDDPDDPGRPVLDVRRALADPSSFTFYEDERRCPLAASDLAAVVARLATDTALATPGPLHVAGPEPVTRIGLARRIAAALGGDPAVLRSGPLPTDALRPARIHLDSAAAERLDLRVRSLDQVLDALAARVRTR